MVPVVYNLPYFLTLNKYIESGVYCQLSGKKCRNFKRKKSSLDFIGERSVHFGRIKCSSSSVSMQLTF